MGKTRLAREFSARAAGHGSRVLWGGCSEFDQTLPFLPFNEAIGTYPSTKGGDSVIAELGPLAATISPIVPGLAGHAPQSPDTSDVGSRLALFEGAVAVLRAVALGTSSGAVLVVDDMQWADESTLNLLDFVVRRIRDIPLLIVATYRTDELVAVQRLRPVVAGWQRAGLAEISELRPLSTVEVGQFTGNRLGGAPVRGCFLDVIADRSEGVPFRRL